MKIRGNTVGTTMPRPDWNQEDPKKADYICNKPKVITSTKQTLTPEQQAQARANIGAMSGTASIEDGILVVRAATIENNTLIMK